MPDLHPTEFHYLGPGATMVAGPQGPDGPAEGPDHADRAASGLVRRGEGGWHEPVWSHIPEARVETTLPKQTDPNRDIPSPSPSPSLSSLPSPGHESRKKNGSTSRGDVEPSNLRDS